MTVSQYFGLLCAIYLAGTMSRPIQMIFALMCLVVQVVATVCGV